MADAAVLETRPHHVRQGQGLAEVPRGDGRQPRRRSASLTPGGSDQGVTSASPLSDVPRPSHSLMTHGPCTQARPTVTTDRFDRDRRVATHHDGHSAAAVPQHPGFGAASIR